MPNPSKPTALKILHGDFEKNPQRRPTNEPVGEQGTPPMPRHLKGVARRAWTRQINQLVKMKIVTKQDVDIIEQYAVLYAQWRLALKDVQVNGITYSVVDQMGNKKWIRNPMDVALMDYSRQLHRLLCEVGLTPAARTKVQATEQTSPDNNPAAKYLGAS